MRQVLAWEKMLPVYQEVYRQTYDAQDIEAMIAFYESSAGQRMVERQPALFRNLMAAIGRVMEPEMAALRERTERRVEQLRGRRASAVVLSPAPARASRTAPSPW